jgi:hypothetical protein
MEKHIAARDTAAALQLLEELIGNTPRAAAS